MECMNCQRLSNDLKNLTIALKNIKKWIRDKLEIEIPRCLDYPEPNLVGNEVEVEDEDQLYEKRLKNHNLMAVCLEKKAFVRLERLSLSATTTAQIQTQGSVASIAEDYKYDYDVDNNDGQNLESRSESEASRRDILIQNNSDEDDLLPSINTNLKRISCERKRPSSNLISSIFKKRKVITSTTTSNIKSNSSYQIEDNYSIDEPSQKSKTKSKKGKIKNLLCPECGKLLRSTKSLKYHRLNFHAATADQECPHCTKKFTKRGLKTHTQLIHPTDPKSLQRICPFCATIYKNPYLLKRHIKRIHNEDHTKFKCSFTDCNREFYMEYDLKHHAKCHSEDINVAKPFKCTFDDKCDKRFDRMFGLKMHIKGFHQGQGRKDQGFVCQNLIVTDSGVREKCGKSFSSRPRLKLHNYSVHNQQYEFKCTAEGCFQSYTRESLLISHLKFHEKAIFKECPICLKQINISRSINRLNRHVESIHGDKRWLSCPFENCGKSCNSYDDLKLHNFTVHGERYKYKCTVGDCFQSYKQQKSLVSHIKCVHEGKKTVYYKYKYPCSFENCSKSFKGIAVLGIHVKKCHPDHYKPEDYPESAKEKVHYYSCTECTRKFQYYSNFVRHQTKHLPGHISKVVNYSCHICNMKFKRKANVSLHVQAVHSGLKPFACNYENCDKTFALRYYLKHHISIVHLGKRKPQIKKYKRKRKPRPKKDLNLKVVHQGKSKRYSCPHENCDMSFTTHSQLKRHNHSVHNDKQYEFKCSFDGCLKSFMKRGNLIAHLNSHEKYGNEIINEKGERKIFKECPICLKQINVTQRRANFNQHIELVHEGKRSYSCTFDNCEKSFKNKENFGYHVKKHHPAHFKPEEYPPATRKDYICSECNRKFNHFSNLVQHKSTHLKVGTFSCDFCDLKFKRKTDLPNHVQAVHSGLRPFACTYENCDKAFALKYYLTSHISQVHLGKTRAKPKLKK